MKEDRLELQTWNSNNKESMDKISFDENESSYEQGKSLLRLKKVLGINWDIEKNLFVLNFEKIIQLTQDLKFTKINLLKINATLFDPLGLIFPITLQGKLSFKLLCVDKSDLDNELNDIFKEKFLKFFNYLKNTKKISTSRFIYGVFKEQICNIELHYFCDSLLQAYCSVIYIRAITNFCVEVNLTCSKTKVSPMKEVTIPRLEFMFCVLLTKLLQFVLNGLSLNIANIYCCHDSMIALYWIQNNQEWKIWIQNCVDNPADIATRECLLNLIANNKLLWFGPEILLRNKESWPEDKFVSDVTDQLRSATKSNVAVNIEYIDQPKQNISAVINIDKYNSLMKVLKISFYALKFVRIIYEKTFKKSLIKKDNIFDCELLWLKDMI